MIRRSQASHTTTELFHQLSVSTDPDGWVDYDFLITQMTIAAVRGDKDALKPYLKRPTINGDRNKAALAHVTKTLTAYARGSASQPARIVIDDARPATRRTPAVARRVKFVSPDLATEWRQPVPPDHAPIVPPDPVGKKGNSVPEREFAGIMESDAWKASPLRQYDLVFFTAPGLTMEALTPYLPDGVKEEAPIHSATRLLCPLGAGEVTRRAIQHAALMQRAPVQIKNINQQVYKRRNLNELDRAFYEQMAKHYMPITLRRLHSRVRSLFQYQGDDRSEMESKAALMFVEIAASYDDSKSDFGQFLNGKLINKANDDARSYAGGRNASDMERSMRRAQEELSDEGLPATVANRAKKLGISEAKVSERQLLLNNIYGKRYADSLSEPTGEDDDTSLAEKLAGEASDHVADYERWTDLTAAFTRLLDASEPTDRYRTPARPTGGYSDHGVVTPNIAGLWAYIGEYIHDTPREHAARDLAVSPRTQQRIRDQIEKRIDNPDLRGKTEVEEGSEVFRDIIERASSRAVPADNYTCKDAVAVHGEQTPNLIGLLAYQADLIGNRTIKELATGLHVSQKVVRASLSSVN